MAINVNIIELLNEHLERKLKDDVLEKFVEQKVKQFEAELRESIKPLFEELVIEKIDTLYSLGYLDDQINIVMKWSGDDEN